MNNSLTVVNLSMNDIEFSGQKRNCNTFLVIVFEPILKLPKRILLSFVPPIIYNRQYLYADCIGPTLSTLVLVSLLQYGFNCKKIRQYEISSINAVFAVLSYYLIVSFFIYIATRIVHARLKILDVITLIGYSFYGIILTLLIPFAVNNASDYVFYTSLILFSGLSCTRVLLIVLFSVDIPIARFLICIVIGNMHILFAIYLYYFYVHPTYKFGV